MGLLTVNQALEILNLPSVADGDRRIQALNMIDQTQAAQYQAAQAAQLQAQAAQQAKGARDNESQNGL